MFPRNLLRIFLCAFESTIIIELTIDKYMSNHLEAFVASIVFSSSFNEALVMHSESSRNSMDG